MCTARSRGRCTGAFLTVAGSSDAWVVARFQREKLADFKQYVTGFIRLQIEHSERVEQHWRELLPRLEEIETPVPKPPPPVAGTSASPTPAAAPQEIS